MSFCRKAVANLSGGCKNGGDFIPNYSILALIFNLFGFYLSERQISLNFAK